MSVRDHRRPAAFRLDDPHVVVTSPDEPPARGKRYKPFPIHPNTYAPLSDVADRQPDEAPEYRRRGAASDGPNA